MGYVVKENFKEAIKNKDGAKVGDKSFAVGDMYDGQNYAQLTKGGFVVDQKNVDGSLLAEIEKKVVAKTAELADLRAKCDALKKKLALNASDSAEKE